MVSASGFSTKTALPRSSPSQARRAPGAEQQGKRAGERFTEGDELLPVRNGCLNVGEESRVTARPVRGVGHHLRHQGRREEREERLKESPGPVHSGEQKEMHLPLLGCEAAQAEPEGLTLWTA